MIDQRQCGICHLVHQKSLRYEHLSKRNEERESKKSHPIEARPQERCSQPRCWGLFCRTKPRKGSFCCNTGQRSCARGTLVVRPHWLCSCKPWRQKEAGDGLVGATCQTWRAHRGPSQQPFWQGRQLRRVNKSLAPQIQGQEEEDWYFCSPHTPRRWWSSQDC